MFEDYLSNTLETIAVPGLSGAYTGKVRQTYDAPGSRRIIITTDRLSAFDRQITTIPLKGLVLTQLSRFWFEATTDICPNHVLAYPDPNVVVCQKLDMLPVEVIVRGYLAGSTATSILKMYKAGKRTMYGVTFPDGLCDNQKLPAPILTPTTKAATNDHDAPLSPQQIVAQNIVDKKIWDTVSAYAFELFAYGQKVAAEKGLILVDTKYEFGLLPDGTVVLGDEIHTPDSSRYWIADTYDQRLSEGKAPDVLDKDVVRRWLGDQCDPYKDALPPIPDDLRLKTTAAYVSVYEKLTGHALELPDADRPQAERIRKNLELYLSQNP